MKQVTHLINSDIVPTQDNAYMVRFAFPDEFISVKPFEKATSNSDIERRIQFMTRNYIVSKLCSWLNQRTHAVPSHRKDIASLLNWLECYQKTSLTNIVAFVNRYMNAFMSIAPAQHSRTYNHYASVIEPIFNFCKDNKGV